MNENVKIGLFAAAGVAAGYFIKKQSCNMPPPAQVTATTNANGTTTPAAGPLKSVLQKIGL